MFPHYPSVTISHFVKTLRRQLPHTLYVLAALACVTLCFGGFFNNHLRSLFRWSGEVHAQQVAEQDIESVSAAKGQSRAQYPRERTIHPEGRLDMRLDKRSVAQFAPAVVAPSLS